MEMLTDNPTSRDRFGFNPYAEILGNTIHDTDSLPFSIGIFGEWGAGKSSLMLMIEENVSVSTKIKTIWFNPWKYDKKEELWSALIQSILYKIAEDSSRSDLKEKAKKLAISAGWNIIKRGLSSITGGIITEDNIDTIKNIIAEEDELHYKYINEFEKDFEIVVDEYTDNGKLVIFIDDLDRCLPENAITVLESLKLFIGNARCVFVLGMDQIIVEQGIKVRFGEVINLSGRDYLDKIIQVPFYLPPVPFNRLKNALKVPKSHNYDNNIWEVIRYGLNGNPRKSKRFINCFYLTQQILDHTEIDNDLRRMNSIDEPKLSRAEEKFYLAQLLIFQMSFPSFYEHLKLYPEDLRLIYKYMVNASSEDIKNFLSDRKELKEFWEDTELRLFLAKTESKPTENDFPDPPRSKVVEALLNAVSLISDSNKSFYRN